MMIGSEKTKICILESLHGGRLCWRLVENEDEIKEEEKIVEFLFLYFFMLIALNTAKTNLFLCRMHAIWINSCVR